MPTAPTSSPIEGDFNYNQSLEALYVHLDTLRGDAWDAVLERRMTAKEANQNLNALCRERFACGASPFKTAHDTWLYFQYAEVFEGRVIGLRNAPHPLHTTALTERSAGVVVVAPALPPGDWTTLLSKSKATAAVDAVLDALANDEAAFLAEMTNTAVPAVETPSDAAFSDVAWQNAPTEPDLTETVGDVKLPDMKPATIHTSVSLHEYDVPLAALKTFLNKEAIEAADIGLSPARLKAVFAGAEQFPQAVLILLESRIATATARRLAGSLGSGLTQFPAAAVPPFANTVAVIPDDALAATRLPGAPPLVAKRQAAAANLPQFPVDLAFRVATDARKAEDITAVFALRKMQMWARAHHLLLTSGQTQQQAVGGAFLLAAANKEYGETKEFLMNAFNQVFGYMPELPALLPADNPDLRHPASFLLEPLVRDHQNVWLAGQTGVGKTFMVEDLLGRVLGREYLRIQATGDMNVDDLLGGMGGVNGTTQFEYGPLPYCMGRVDGIGRGLYINEVTTAHSDVLFELQAVLEGKPLILKKNRGERIDPAPGFHIIVDDNTLGLGERAEYIGTKVMNEAFRDRFYFLHVDNMPVAQEKAILGRFLRELSTPGLALVADDAEVA